LKIEQDKGREMEAAYGKKLATVQTELEELRLTKEASLLQQKEQFEAQKRELKRGLRDADEEVERQRRELSGSFAVEIHRLDLECQQRREEALQAVSMAEALAQQQEKEAQAAREREAQQADVAQAALQNARLKEQQVAALAKEMGCLRAAHKETISQLDSSLAEVNEERQAALDNARDLERRLNLAQAALNDSTRQHEENVVRARREHQEAVQRLQEQLTATQ
ncbi:unnamed protein product, partial [Ostreobium quekettii]